MTTTYEVGDLIHVFGEVPHADKLDGCGGEGFWVEVTAPRQGRVRNLLAYLPFAFGDLVEFDPNPEYPDGSPIVRVPAAHLVATGDPEYPLDLEWESTP